MTFFQTLSVLFAVAALLSYANHRFIRLPTTIGIMVLTLAASLVLIAIDRTVVPICPYVRTFLSEIDRSQALLHGMLGALLFAGALHVDLDDLTRERVPVIVLSTVGVLVSTAVVALCSWSAAQALGIPLRPGEALVFGALISPTDPVAVIGILRSVGCSKSLETTIVGESLFNDGIGVVVFVVALQFVTAPSVSPADVLVLLGREAIGGAAFGLVLGYAGYRLLKSIDSYPVELLISIAMVTGGYALAEAIHVSAPLAAVVAGLLTGNQGRRFAMSDLTREHLDLFWELVDEVLNALLFVLLGLEILILTLGAAGWFALVTIAIVLVARLVSVALPVVLLRGFRRANRGAVRILTWAGLRGGISVALALSLPQMAGRDTILVATYAVVVFSVIVQGTTIGRLVKRLAAKPDERYRLRPATGADDDWPPQPTRPAAILGGRRATDPIVLAPRGGERPVGVGGGDPRVRVGQLPVLRELPNGARPHLRHRDRRIERPIHDPRAHQRWAHDLVLLSRRDGDQAGAGSRGVADACPSDIAGDRRPRRHDRACGAVLDHQRGGPG